MVSSQIFHEASETKNFDELITVLHITNNNQALLYILSSVNTCHNDRAAHRYGLLGLFGGAPLLKYPPVRCLPLASMFNSSIDLSEVRAFMIPCS